MEAADDFVETMAWLSYLDECDMAARSSSLAGFKKRWEVRREDGLVGRSHPPKARYPAEGGSGSAQHLGGSEHDVSTLVTHHAPRNFEVRPRKIENRVHAGASSGSYAPKNARGVHGHRGLIQQPRKHS